MRQERTVQATIFEVFARHEIGCELKVISQWLDGQRGLVSLVAGDLRRQGVRQTGRRGLSAESVLRCALLKQQRQLSYEELAFHLEDSASFRAFARLPLAWSPKKSVLHQTIGALRAETWEAMNQALLASAQADKLESGAVVRIDSTVSAALMHEPSDSTLLWDAVRVMRRLLRQAAAVPGAPPIGWRDRRRVAKKRARAIDYSRGQDKKCQLYRELIAAAQATRAELQAAAPGLAAIAGTAAERWRAAVDHYLPLIARIIAQSERRDRGRDLLLQTRLWRRTLHLARARPLQGLHLVGGGGPQPGTARPPQTGVAPPAAADDSAAGQINPLELARYTILSPRAATA